MPCTLLSSGQSQVTQEAITKQSERGHLRIKVHGRIVKRIKTKYRIFISSWVWSLIIDDFSLFLVTFVVVVFLYSSLWQEYNIIEIIYSFVYYCSSTLMSGWLEGWLISLLDVVVAVVAIVSLITGLLEVTTENVDCVVADDVDVIEGCLMASS